MFDIKNHEHPFPYIIIENIYSDDELDLIWEELDFLCHPHKLKEPSLSESAFDDDGLMKKNKLLFLDSVYSCLLYTSPSPRDKRQSRMPSSA